MALGDPYATLALLKTRLGITDTTDDTALTAALASASRSIEKYCGRQFNDAGSASARVYYPCSSRLAGRLDDFSTTSGLVVKVDTADSGTFDTTLTATDYQPEPLNGIVDGESGWPFWRIRVVSGTTFPTSSRRAPLQVTARWGWTAVPTPVADACLILAEEDFKMKDSPFGVGGYSQFGIIRVRDNPMAARILMPYKRDALMVA